MQLEDKTYLDKGKRGLVYTAILAGRKVLVKQVNPASAINTVAHEAEMTSKLNDAGIGPAFIAFAEGQLVREYVEGERIEDYLAHATSQQARSVVRQTLDQCRIMDELSINKQEMTHPYKHLLITKEGKVVMIDFERCKYTPKPKNVTQVCQYLVRLHALLEERGVHFDPALVKDLGARYKQEGYDPSLFAQLLAQF